MYYMEFQNLDLLIYLLFLLIQMELINVNQNIVNLLKNLFFYDHNDISLHK